MRGQAVVGAAHEEPANAHVAQLGEGDFLGAGGIPTIGAKLKPGL
jgi:hypothetical protein